MDTKALPFHLTAGHFNMGRDELAIGSGNNQKWKVTMRETGLSANLDVHLFYRLKVPRIKYALYSNDGKNSDSNSPKYKSKSKVPY